PPRRPPFRGPGGPKRSGPPPRQGPPHAQGSAAPRGFPPRAGAPPRARSSRPEGTGGPRPEPHGRAQRPRAPRPPAPQGPLRNLRLLVEYEGTRYAGWQVQAGARTVAGDLLQAIRDTLGESPKLFGAGRTDQGVHAEGQVANFFTRSMLPP